MVRNRISATHPLRAQLYAPYLQKGGSVSRMTKTTPDPQLQLRRDVRELRKRNEKLATLLKSSRDKLAQLTTELNALQEPVSTYGVFLRYAPGNRREADVFTSTRRLRVNVSPLLEHEIPAGAQVRLGEASVIVEDCGFTSDGVVMRISEFVDGGGDADGDVRVLASTPQGNTHVIHLATPLVGNVRVGDNVLADVKSGFAFERISQAEVTQLALEEIPDVTYDDIGGLDAQIEQVRDAVEMPFDHPELYRDYQLHPPKGVLLYGPPGCGKTLIAKAVAHSLASRVGDGSASYFLNVKGPELLNKYVGETERVIRLIFERARELASDGAPVIVFFDEMESIFRTRGTGVSSDIETTAVPQLLTEIDGVEGLDNVIVVGATNREELIDPALLRPGRLDIKVRISRPSKQEAPDIISRYLHDGVPHIDPLSVLIDGAVDALYAPRPFVELTLRDGSTAVLHYGDFVSGALIANVVDRAKKLAIKDYIASGSTGEHGISLRHIQAAVRTEQDESEDLPNTANPEEWNRIVKLSQSVVSARSLA